VSGTWTWHLVGEQAIGDPILPRPLRILLVPDLSPRIDLLFPSPDTLLGPDGVMPIVVDAEDDIGLRSVLLRSWRSGLGEDRSERREALAPNPDGARRAAFRHLLDRGDQDLLPGDTVFYQFEAFDGHPTRGPAISDVFLLRIPTFTEIQNDRAERTDALAEAAQNLEEAVDALAEAAADAARRIDAEEGGEQSAFETTEEARAVLEEAEQAADDLTGLEEKLAALREDLAESALSDEALAGELEKLAERYRELLDAGLRQRIDELAAALQDLDPEAVRQVLEQLSNDSDRLREQLEQTLGMLEQAAIDQAMKSAQANVEDLARRQRELAESEAVEPQDWVDEQERMAAEAEKLAQALEDLERRLQDTGNDAAADSAGAAGERTTEASGSMQEAARQMAEAEAGDPQGRAERRSRDAAAEAAEAMEQASEALGSAQQNTAQQNREAATRTLGRARSEALSLAEEEGRLAEATRGQDSVDPEGWRARQAAVRQGLENMLGQLAEAGNEAAMLDRGTGVAAGEAADRMDRLLERLAQDGARRLPSRAEAEEIQASLNQLAAQLLASEQAARSGEQQSQGEQAGEQMASLAQEQQGVTQETSSLLMPGPKPSGEERMREVARQQQEIADRLNEVDDPDGELLGRPEEMAAEAAELARRLAEDGPTQETLERQRRLFRRMLDAGRSLEDEDLDENRRESETGTAGPREIPDIDPSLLRGRRFPLPSEDVLRGLPVFYRQLIFEYFDRLNRPVPTEGRRGGGGGGGGGGG
jgi:polyhydroxyalkanoate synthesis regulator protein